MMFFITRHLVYILAATREVVKITQTATSTAKYGCRVNGPSKYDVTPGGGSRPGASGEDGIFLSFMSGYLMVAEED